MSVTPVPFTAAALAAFAASAFAQEAPPQRRPEAMLLPQIVVLPRDGKEIAVDGSLTDWPDLPAIRMDDQRQLSGTAYGAWRGADDLGAIMFMLWDADALYIACPVKDEWHRGLDKTSMAQTEIPATDSILLTFDPGRDTRSSGPDPGRRDDREFWLADEAARQIVQWDRLRGSARVLEGDSARVVVLHDKERGITSYEARIPWSEILPVGAVAKAGLVLDVQVVVNDFDESTDSMAQTRAGLTFGCAALVDPGLFASMMLVPDAAALQGAVPEFPPKPGLREPPLPPLEHWQQLTAELLAAPPAIYDGTTSPADCGGVERLKLLERIDRDYERWPRFDYLELHQRIHRRMTREVAGISARGLPRWWFDRLQGVVKAIKDPVPDNAARIHRLPMGGWLLRTKSRCIAIDATGAELAEAADDIETCVLTQPLDMTRRNDQLLVRMALAEPPRPFITHVVFHLPVVPMETIAHAEPGKTYPQPSGARIRALGTTSPDGSVTWSCSYRIELPGGPSVLLVSSDLSPDDVEAQSTDVAIVSPRNSAAAAIVRKVEPDLVVIDEAFTCQPRGDLRRVSLRDVHALQEALRPTRSLVLAPGEAWTITARKR